MTITADEPMLREGGRDAAPSELAATEMPRGPEIMVDGLFGPKTNTAVQVVPALSAQPTRQLTLRGTVPS